MARRRLLTILASSALLSATFAGPVAAAELAGAGEDAVVEVPAETAEVAEQAVEDVVDTVVDEPVAEVTQAVEEAVAPEPAPSPSPAPSPTAEEPAAPAATNSDEPDGPLVAAGDVTAAPSLAFLTGTGGSAPATAAQSRLDVPALTPVTDPAPADSEPVPAPQVAPAPAEVAEAPAPSALAQAASRAAHDEGIPVMVLVAIASLLAAGFGTVRGARAAA